MSESDEKPVTPEQLQAIWELDERGVYLNVCPPEHVDYALRVGRAFARWTEEGGKL